MAYVSIAALLKHEIESWAEEFARNSALKRLAISGRLQARSMTLYLESLRFVFEQSQVSLALAAQRCQELGDTELERYFRAKVQEETGHQLWALDDLRRFGEHNQRPAPSSVALVELQRRAIARHPFCMTAYAVWAEYFTVLLGDEWLDALAVSGYRRDGVTAITKHIEADRAHSAATFAELDRLWRGQPEPEVLLSIVEEAGRIFEDFSAEVCAESAPPMSALEAS